MRIEIRKNNNLVLYSLLFLQLIFSNNFFAQSNYNFKTFANEFKSYTNQPGNWDRNDILTVLGAAGLTYGTMYFDASIREFVLKNNKYKNSFSAEFGRVWGEPLSTLAIGGSFYLHGIAMGNNVNKKIGFEIGESAFYTSIITLILKFSFGRERPRENSDPFSFYPFSFKDDNFTSLSSGHTALAFSLSTVLSKNVSNNYLKIIAFAPAVMTALSRIYQNHHWTSDVLLGAIIGYTVADFTYKLHGDKSNSDSRNELPQMPVNLFNFKIAL